MYRIVWEIDSLHDRNSIMTFLFHNSNESVAVAVEDKIIKSADNLTIFPRMGVKVKNAYRITVKGTKYLIFYTVDEDNKIVKILRVLHSSKKLPS